MERQRLCSTTVKTAMGIIGIFGLGNCGSPPAESLDHTASALAISMTADRGEIVDSGSPFEDTNTVAWAQAGRAAARICTKRGLSGGFFTGNQEGDKKGLVCVGGGAQLLAATPGELLDSGWDFADTNTVGWAQAGRAAARICGKRGFIGGYFTGDQTEGSKGIICVNEGARWFNPTPGEILDSGWPFDDSNTINWAQASRAAASLCAKYGFNGGFFNGGQTLGRRGLICVR